MQLYILSSKVKGRQLSIFENILPLHPYLSNMLPDKDPLLFTFLLPYCHNDLPPYLEDLLYLKFPYGISLFSIKRKKWS